MNATTNHTHQPLPRSKRALSHFLARELLYDFMMGRLDLDRTAAMHEFLKLNSDLQEELQAMRSADAYLENLAKTKITREHLDDLSGVRSKAFTYMAQFRFQNWPDIVKWTSEAFLISFAVAILGLFVPWRAIGNQLSNKVGPQILSVLTLDYLRSSGDSENYQQPSDTNINQPAGDGEKNVELAANVTVGANEIKKPDTIKTEEKVAPPSATETKLAEENTVIAMNEASGQTSVAPREKPAAKKDPQLEGFVYSMMMSLTNTNELTPEIREKIRGFGGAKAGQVELGWRKTNPPGSYFHFSMPEANYEQLTQTLGQYGRVRIYKNPHERLMPEGQIRIILWIEDNMVNTQDEEKPQK